MRRLHKYLITFLHYDGSVSFSESVAESFLYAMVSAKKNIDETPKVARRGFYGVRAFVWPRGAQTLDEAIIWWRNERYGTKLGKRNV